MNASSNVINDAIIPAQIRAGRAIIGWTQERLAAESGLPKRTIARIELGEGMPRSSTLAAIRTALEAAGVEFVPENGGGAGVRLMGPAKRAARQHEADEHAKREATGISEARFVQRDGEPLVAPSAPAPKREPD